MAKEFMLYKYVFETEEESETPEEVRSCILGTIPLIYRGGETHDLESGISSELGGPLC